MSDSTKNMDAQERRIREQAEDINPREDRLPDSLAEATTAPLEDDELGENATQDDVRKQCITIYLLRFGLLRRFDLIKV